VEFRGDRANLWKANLWSRVASRIVVRADEFHASTFHELERRAKKIEWKRFVPPGSAVRFRVTCRKSKLYHSDAVAERLGKAAARAVDAKVAQDSDDEDASSDAQLFVVRLANDICTISADSSGDLLHRRGYRQAVAKAPLRETLAAAMLIGSGWKTSSPLIDPMCGSGTIPIEGAMMARRIAPGIGRRFAFEKWPDHDAAGWKSTTDAARAAELRKAPARIIASDRDAGAVEATKANAARAGVENDIEIGKRSVSEIEFPGEPGWVVSNPPYGLRVGESGPLRNLYSRLGRILEERAPGYVLALLSADRALDAQLGLDLREIFRTTNGGIPVRLVAGRHS
jgi:putative N6-adenine-specific DNA methylase